MSVREREREIETEIDRRNGVEWVRKIEGVLYIKIDVINCDIWLYNAQYEIMTQNTIDGRFTREIPHVHEPRVWTGTVILFHSK